MAKIFVFLLFLVVGVLSCSPLRLQHSIKTSGHDWIMYGGRMERTNVAPCTVTPPLVRVWTYDASAGFSPYSVAVAESLVFIANLQGEIRIVRVSDGQEVSSHDFGSAIFGTPVIENDTMYITMSRNETNLFAYTLTTGGMQWKQKVGDVETAPLMIHNRLFVTTYGGELLSVNKSTGDIVWTFKIPAPARTGIIRSSPASDTTTIVFGCDDGKLYAVTADSGKLRWSTATRGSIVASPSVSDGKVFVGSLDSTFYAFSLDSGKVLWRRSLGSRIYGSQAVSAGHVYVGTSGGELYCLDGTDGTSIWCGKVKSILSSAPLVSDSVVYAGCADKKLYAFSAGSGALLGNYQLEGRIKAGPVACDGYLLVLDDDRTVNAFQQLDK
jgi:outer membrane protein assembly factor BamB